MRRAITASHDVFGDVDRLANEHPDQVGERMAAKLATRSFEGPILAIIALGPLLWTFATKALFRSWPTANWIDASFSDAAGGLRWLMVIFAALTLWFCHGFRPGHTPSRFWKPAVLSAALMIPPLSLFTCREASRAVGLAGVTLFFAIGVLWALRQSKRER
jgi:hypothetical protein